MTHDLRPDKDEPRERLVLWRSSLACAAKNPWLASLLLRQAQRLRRWQIELVARLHAVWAQSQAGRVLIYCRLKAMRPNKRLVASTVTGAALILASTAPALAGTITVNSLADNGSGGCTLREAIEAANTNASFNDCAINVAPGADTIDMTGLSGTITLASDLPVITETVQLNGPGPAALTINGANNYAIYGTGPATSVGVDGLTITNVSGDGVYATQSITLTNSIVTGNSCGAYVYDGSVYVSNSTVTGLGCHGVYSYNNSVTIIDSTVSGNIYGVFAPDGSATIIDSTVTGNIVGVLAFGDAMVNNSVITATVADGVNSYANTTVISSTVTGNFSGVNSYNGNSDVVNSTITGGDYGVYSYNGNSIVENSTVTGGDYGVYSYGNSNVENSTVTGGENGVQSYGNSVVENSIVTGTANDAVHADGGDVMVSNSTLTGGDDGADSDAGDVLVSNSIVTGADKGISAYGRAVVTSSTITGNLGNGIYAGNEVEVLNSTISGSGQHGVESVTGQAITIKHSTIANNSGYGIVTNSGPTLLHNTIVAQNGGAGTTRDINGTLDGSSSYNLIGNGDLAGISNGTNGNLVGSDGALLDPELGPLQDNGGSSPTHLPGPTSPALDAGDPSFSPPPTFDQRGPGFPRVLVGRIDIGAIEAELRLYLPILFKFPTFFNNGP